MQAIGRGLTSQALATCWMMARVLTLAYVQLRHYGKPLSENSCPESAAVHYLVLRVSPGSCRPSEAGAQKNLVPLCKMTTYLSVPTIDVTWIMAPPVEDMRRGLDDRKAGRPSRFNVLVFVKEDLCEDMPDFIDEGQAGYVEVHLGGRVYSGGVSPSSIKKIVTMHGAG